MIQELIPTLSSVIFINQSIYWIQSSNSELKVSDAIRIRPLHCSIMPLKNYQNQYQPCHDFPLFLALISTHNLCPEEAIWSPLHDFYCSSKESEAPEALAIRPQFHFSVMPLKNNETQFSILALTALFFGLGLQRNYASRGSFGGPYDF